MSSGNYSGYFTSIIVLITLGMFFVSTLIIVSLCTCLKLIKDSSSRKSSRKEESDIEMQSIDIESETESSLPSVPSIIVKKEEPE